MKLKELTPNASYDNVAGKPEPIYKDNDGSYLYRYNIEAETNDEGQQVGWKCREIRIWVEPTKGNLKRAIIRSVISETEEFSLVNNYNRHVLGIKEDEVAVERYKEYLVFTEDISAMLINDLI